MVMGSAAEETGQKETNERSWKAPPTSSPLSPTPMQLLPLPLHLFKNNMKRMANGSEISLIPFRSSGEDQGELYDRGFRPIADGMEEDIDGADEEEACGAASGGAVKKRRLSMEQVRALEKSFEMENKLEPERKVQLATDLGLQPRQVAVWFQNRRARWKTKQLERDYTALQASYDALRLDFDILRRDKESLLSQINNLTSKLTANETISLSSAIKEEPAVSETVAKDSSAPIGKVDGASDSDSSALVNDTNTTNDVENSPPLTAASDILSAAAAGEDLGGGCSSALMNPNLRSRFFYQNQELLKMDDEEEEEFLSEPCGGFFADEQAVATLNWYYSDHWN